MDKWRPKGWENPHKDCIPECCDCGVGFEEGADAILEALKHKVGSHRNKGNSGWFVFIPDKE